MENKIEVLVVEDSPTQAMLLKHMLRQHSFEASIAKNGAEALEVVKKQKPTLVISDVMMPVMDGVSSYLFLPCCQLQYSIQYLKRKLIHLSILNSGIMFFFLVQFH